MLLATNGAAFVESIKKLPEQYDNRFRRAFLRIIAFTHDEVMELTPVHSGLTVRNFIVTMGRPEGGYYEEVRRKADKGQTGVRKGRGGVGKQHRPRLEGTPLGEENRRKANEREARRTRRDNVDLTNHPYKNIFITNNAPFAWEVEMGRLPKDPYEPRNWHMMESTFANLIARNEEDFWG
jgi:hypothetical protein